MGLYVEDGTHTHTHTLLFHKIGTLSVQVKSNMFNVVCVFQVSDPSPKLIRSAMKKMEALNVEMSEMEQRATEVDERNRSLMLKKKALSGELEGLRARGDACQKECRQWLKERELSREEEAEFMGSRCKLLTRYSHSKNKKGGGEAFEVRSSCEVIVFSPPGESWK